LLLLKRDLISISPQSWRWTTGRRHLFFFPPSPLPPFLFFLAASSKGWAPSNGSGISDKKGREKSLSFFSFPPSFSFSPSTRSPIDGRALCRLSGGRIGGRKGGPEFDLLILFFFFFFPFPLFSFPFSFLLQSSSHGEQGTKWRLLKAFLGTGES